MLVKRVYNIKQAFTLIKQNHRITDNEGKNKNYNNNIKLIFFSQSLKNVKIDFNNQLVFNIIPLF